jgi:hypothetical protein
MGIDYFKNQFIPGLPRGVAALKEGLCLFVK